MRLRTSALVAGALGLVVLAIGLIADAHRLDAVATPTATLDTPVVVIGPEMLALAPSGVVSVSGDGPLVANAGRPVDVQAWLNARSATQVMGIESWESLSVRLSERLEVREPAVEEDAADEDASAGADQSADLASVDHWREVWQGDGNVSVAVAEIPAGMPLVVHSVDGSPLSDVTVALARDLGDGWISPLIWWGAILTGVGLLAAIFLLIDIRPLQERTETWLAHRRHGARTSASNPQPGSRRARRAAGELAPGAASTTVNGAGDDGSPMVEEERS